VALDAATARGNSGRVHSYSTRISRVTHLCPLCEVPSTISAGHLVAVRACSLPSSLSHARHARAVERFRCYRLARLPHPIALARPCTATRALGTSCVLTPLRAMLWQGQSVVAQHSLRADERRERGAGALAAFLRVARVACRARVGGRGRVERSRPTWRGGRAMLALSLTLTLVASVVSQMVQDEATNGRDAVRGRRPARRVALVVCAAVVWWSRDVHRLPLRSGN
jgi:hypothetical protein